MRVCVCVRVNEPRYFSGKQYCTFKQNVGVYLNNIRISLLHTYRSRSSKHDASLYRNVPNRRLPTYISSLTDPINSVYIILTELLCLPLKDAMTVTNSMKANVIFVRRVICMYIVRIQRNSGNYIRCAGCKRTRK